jgi:pimeloyl-ACP methyl ester carboxylesterase
MTATAAAPSPIGDELAREPDRDLDPDRFEIHRDTSRGFSQAYIREGIGGAPLLLVHGWPDSKRIWWRVIEPLADAGFEVIVPDLRGFGDSETVPGPGDVPTFSRDLYALVHDVLGHHRIVGAAGDLGARVVQDMALRFGDFVDRMVLWNGALPIVPSMAEAGLAHLPRRIALDYHVRNGTDADGLAAELDTADKRRRYVAGMYTHRWWAHPDSFTLEAVDFHTEPFGDAATFRASLLPYESIHRADRRSEPAMLAPTDKRAMLLFGAADHVVPPDFDRMGPHVFSNLAGPFVIRDAGHWIQWEAPEVLTSAVTSFASDLLIDSHSEQR